jgi:hypothetical protein
MVPENQQDRWVQEVPKVQHCPLDPWGREVQDRLADQLLLQLPEVLWRQLLQMDPPIQLHQTNLALRRDLRDLEIQSDPENQVIQGLQACHLVLANQGFQLGRAHRDFLGLRMVQVDR